MKNLSKITLLILPIMLSACSWKYEANHEILSSKQEEVSFTLTGYDPLYGEAPPTNWVISYPKSARDHSTNTIRSKDFTSFIGDRDSNLDTLTGFIIVNPTSKVESRLARKLYRRDGSFYTRELPFNGIYSIK